MSRPRLLDLFCGAGGASMGYHRAGFDVTGVDLHPQRHYPFAFIRADALAYLAAHGHEYDAIAASPPCQKFSTLRAMANAGTHPDMVGPVRELLLATNKPYVIENVPGAPLLSPVMLCGTMFGLGSTVGLEYRQLRRHRLFESNRPLQGGRCRHHGKTIGFFGDHARLARRQFGKDGERGDISDSRKVTLGREVMEVPWMDWSGITQAIPPAYTECIGRQLIERLQTETERQT
jgi:DNA (cytosine-5)-methyltransferase 1